MSIGRKVEMVCPVGDTDLASTIYPGCNQPPVLATAQALAWAERLVLECLGGTAVGAYARVSHLTPAVLGAHVTVLAECIELYGSRSTWLVELRDHVSVVASVWLEFRSVDYDRYVTQYVAPKRESVT